MMTITFSREIWQTTKILVLKNFRLYGTLNYEIREALTKFANLVLVTAAISSSFARVTTFNSVTRDSDITSVTWSLRLM